MAIDKVNDRQWVLIIKDEDGRDIELEINATIEGLEIDEYGTIYWEELEEFIP